MTAEEKGIDIVNMRRNLKVAWLAGDDGVATRSWEWSEAELLDHYRGLVSFWSHAHETLAGPLPDMKDVRPVHDKTLGQNIFPTEEEA